MCMMKKVLFYTFSSVFDRFRPCKRMYTTVKVDEKLELLVKLLVFGKDISVISRQISPANLVLLDMLNLANDNLRV